MPELPLIQKKIVIAGGGFSGLGVAIELLNNNIRDFVILEKASQLGGTWRENTYPGCACDVPSQFYSYSFAPKPDWTRFFAEQPEIQAYLLEVAEQFGVMPHVELSTPLQEAHWDASRRRWIIQTKQATYEAQYLLACQGPLHEPRIPDLPGIDRFKGTIFHSAQWNHDHDLRGKRVAVVGTGSSAIQFVPKIQPDVAQLYVYQRTAPWVLPKPDRDVTDLEKQAFARVPGLQKSFRNALYNASELLQWAQREPARMRPMERLAESHMNRQVSDPALRARLKPTFSLGCKRLLLSNTWYPAIQAPNAELISGGVQKITPNGLIGDDGTERQVDTIIFGTGFHVSDASVPGLVHGRHGETLDAAWQGSPEAYLGTSVHGFPNMFLLLGPNLGNGHGSAFVIIEAQARYILDAIRRADRNGIEALEVRADKQHTWNQRVQRGLENTVWNAGGCNSWYLDGNGKNSSIYPWSTFDMRARMRRFDMHAFHKTYVADQKAPPAGFDLESAVVMITGGAHGIGLATARQFVEAGARVAIADLDLKAAQQAAKSLGPKAHAWKLDVTSRTSFEACVAGIESELGEIDVLVNNAGVMPSGEFLAESDDLDAAVMSVNHWGTSLGMKLVLPGMLARGRGHVVNVASLAGKFAVPFLASYAASKHATVGLSASVRAEIAGSGVTISTVMPSAVNTRLTGGIPLDGLFAQQPEDVAHAIVKSCRTREAEITVPEAAKPLMRMYGMLPAVIADKLPKLLGADRLLRPEVRQARAGYERRSVKQGRGKTGPSLRFAV